MALPEVLAGPIVRRSTMEEVNVWLATSVPLPNPELLLFDGNGTVPLVANASHRSVKLGLRLFVHMFTASAEQDPFPTGVPIGYDIIAAGERGLAQMMSNHSAVRLLGFRNPTFVLQDPGIGRLHALYGSCRKIHGPRPDMMRAAEHIMQTKPLGRPEVLMLGGDQIYADDVWSMLLPSIYRLGIELVGHEQIIPGLPYPAHSPEADRGKFLKRAFSSGEMEQHLLTFGEYAATYLFAWNPELWARSEVSVIPAHLLQQPIPGTRMKEAMRGAFAARRVLANIVTYMIFDDHEITDDWYLNAQWRDRVEETDWASHVVLNGLCAYWAFQGWGNEPAAFSKRFERAMEPFANLGNGVSSAKSHLHGQSWSYLAPTSPPALVLDTRTRRTTSPKMVEARPPDIQKYSATYAKTGWPPEPVATFRNDKAPRLLDKFAMRRLNKLLDEIASPSPLIVVAAAPIFGFRPIEELQEFIGTNVSPATGDLESWAANPRNLADFVNLLARNNVDLAVVLSGDVHYAFEMAISISNADRTLRIAQFCSSAFKNRPTHYQRWGSNALRKTGDRKRAIAWWDLAEGNPDGPIKRYHAQKDWHFDSLVRAHKGPSFVVSEQLNPRDGGGVTIKNNIGELIIDGTEISHRFWLGLGTDGFGPNDLITWKPGSWPAPRLWL